MEDKENNEFDQNFVDGKNCLVDCAGHDGKLLEKIVEEIPTIREIPQDTRKKDKHRTERSQTSEIHIFEQDLKKKQSYNRFRVSTASATNNKKPQTTTKKIKINLDGKPNEQLITTQASTDRTQNTVANNTTLREDRVLIQDIVIAKEVNISNIIKTEENEAVFSNLKKKASTKNPNHIKISSSQKNIYSYSSTKNCFL